nr:hypothetical protein [uncultured Arsenicibacter sp.]
MRCHHGVSQSDAGTIVGTKIVKAASRDVGTQERTWRNEHPLFDYYRVLAGSRNPVSRQGWYEPYCGYAVNAWHRQAGLKPSVKSPGTALSWSYHPTKIKLGPFAPKKEIDRLAPGWVVGFRFGRQNHVGILEEKFPLYAITIEGNTSLSGAIGTYKLKTEGVIRKKRFWKDMVWATDWRTSPPADTVPVFKLRAKYLPP